MPKLVLTFRTLLGKRVSVNIPEPKENLTETVVRNAMEAIIANGSLMPSGATLAGIHSAKIVDSSTTYILRDEA